MKHSHSMPPDPSSALSSRENAPETTQGFLTLHEDKISPRLSHKSMYNRYNPRMITFLVMGPYWNHLSPRDWYFSETSNVLCRHYGTERSHDSIKMFPLLGSNHPNMENNQGIIIPRLHAQSRDPSCSARNTDDPSIGSSDHKRSATGGTQLIPGLDREVTTVPPLEQ